MTTATDVLTYIRQNYQTQGKMQRQKLLYYVQAWHLAWNGRQLFSDPVYAWRMGPVVKSAWHADSPDTTSPTPTPAPVDLSSDAVKTIQAVVAYYGRFSGTELSARTHREQPWLEAYEHVSPIMRGSMEIRPTAMRSFYSLQALEGEERPARPVTQAQTIPLTDLSELMSQELPRWGGVLALLAER